MKKINHSRQLKLINNSVKRKAPKLSLVYINHFIDSMVPKSVYV